MMGEFTVALFGHREIDDLSRLEALLSPLVRRMIAEHEYVTFLIGRHGEFDEFAASVIKRTRRGLADNSELVLVLPYTVANIESYDAYYDRILIPEEMSGTHPKGVIEAKNRWMVEQADLVVAYVEHPSGGAYRAMKYAERKGKPLLRLPHDADPEV